MTKYNLSSKLNPNTMPDILYKRMKWTPKCIFFRLRNNIVRSDPRRGFLLRELPKHSVGCELGVWRGDFSEHILSIVRPARLLLVDPWAYQPELGYEIYGGTVAKSQEEMDAICRDVRERFSDRREVSIIRKKAAQLNDENIADGSLDWVYIDGCHEYEFVLADLRFFFAKVKHGGLICGDDYDLKIYGRVNQAVAEFLQEQPGCELLWTKKHQFMIKAGN